MSLNPTLSTLGLHVVLLSLSHIVEPSCQLYMLLSQVRSASTWSFCRQLPKSLCSPSAFWVVLLWSPLLYFPTSTPVHLGVLTSPLSFLWELSLVGILSICSQTRPRLGSSTIKWRVVSLCNISFLNSSIFEIHKRSWYNNPSFEDFDNLSTRPFASWLKTLCRFGSFSWESIILCLSVGCTVSRVKCAITQSLQLCWLARNLFVPLLLS